MATEVYERVFVFCFSRQELLEHLGIFMGKGQ